MLPKTSAEDHNQRFSYFADDCALNAYDLSDIQASMDKFSTAYIDIGLTISAKKTEVNASVCSCSLLHRLTHQSAPVVSYTDSYINGEKLKVSGKFVQLVSTQSRSAIDDEIVIRIFRTSAEFTVVSPLFCTPVKHWLYLQS